MEVRPTLERDTIVSEARESFLSLNAEAFRIYLEALSMDELADVLTRYEHELTTQQRGLVAEVIAAYDTDDEDCDIESPPPQPRMIFGTGTVPHGNPCEKWDLRITRSQGPWPYVGAVITCVLRWAPLCNLYLTMQTRCNVCNKMRVDLE